MGGGHRSNLSRGGPMPNPREYVVIEDFDAEEYGDDYLTVSKGDAVIWMREEDEWVWVKSDTAEGWVPPTYVMPKHVDIFACRKMDPYSRGDSCYSKSLSKYLKKLLRSRRLLLVSDLDGFVTIDSVMRVMEEDHINESRDDLLMVVKTSANKNGLRFEMRSDKIRRARWSSDTKSSRQGAPSSGSQETMRSKIPGETLSDLQRPLEHIQKMEEMPSH